MVEIMLVDGHSENNMAKEYLQIKQVMNKKATIEMVKNSSRKPKRNNERLLIILI